MSSFRGNYWPGSMVGNDTVDLDDDIGYMPNCAGNGLDDLDLVGNQGWIRYEDNTTLDAEAHPDVPSTSTAHLKRKYAPPVGRKNEKHSDTVVGGDGRDEHPSGSKRNALQQDDAVFEPDKSHEEAPNTTTRHGKPKAVPRLRHKKSVKDSFPVTATMKPIRDCLKLLAPQALDEMRQFARESLEEQIQKIQDKLDENRD